MLDNYCSSLVIVIYLEKKNLMEGLTRESHLLELSSYVLNAVC